MPHKDKEIRNAYARKYHQEHKEAIHINQHKYYAKNRERLLSKSKEYQMNNREQQHDWNQKYADGIKTEVLTHYGNDKLTCVVCGEARKDCLSIDHINGGGNKHRRDMNLYGNKFYCWLKKNNLPKGYQTLCMNCQFIKRRFGTKESEDNK